jgi:hypothetical protein
MTDVKSGKNAGKWAKGSWLSTGVALALTLGCGPEGEEALAQASRPAGIVGRTKQALERPARWAKPVSVDGVPNLFQVTEGLYRSAQPTAAGFRAMEERLGLTTDVDLRDGHSDVALLEGTHVRLLSIPMNAWAAKDEDVIAFLKEATRASNLPLLVHCQRGADRSGVQVAAYRIVVEGWSKDDAITEMVDGGYGFSSIWQNLIRYLREMDVPRIKRAAEL